MKRREIRHKLLSFLLLGLLGSSSACVTTDDYVICHVETKPASVEVWVDEKLKDSTPCDLPFQSPGEYKVTLKKDGYLSVPRRITVLRKKNEETGKANLVAIPESIEVTLDPLDEPTPGKDKSPGKRKKPYYKD